MATLARASIRLKEQHGNYPWLCVVQMSDTFGRQMLPWAWEHPRVLLAYALVRPSEQPQSCPDHLYICLSEFRYHIFLWL